MYNNLAMLRAFGVIAQALELDFLVVGAIARDCFLESVEGLLLPRKTLDVDIACAVKSWDEYQKLMAALVTSGNFYRDPKMSHRLRFMQNHLPLDIIPFGGVEDEQGEICWPPDFDCSMRVLGFSAALKSAVLVEKGSLCFKVINPALFALLKLQAWGSDPFRTKDLLDFYYIADNYFELIDADVRVYEPTGIDADILDDPAFDYLCGAARLIGRDTARVDCQVVQRIAEHLKSTSTYGGLVEALSQLALRSNFSLAIRTVDALFAGIDDICGGL